MPQSIYAEGVASNQDNGSAIHKEEVTKSSFVRELRQESKSNDEEVHETAKQNLKKYNELSEKEQDQVIDLMNDPEQFEKMEVETEEIDKKSSELEPLEIGPVRASASMARAASIRREVGYTFHYKIKGIKLYAFRLSVIYQTSGNVVRKVNGSTSYVVYNLNPLTRLALKTKTQYISFDHQAYARAKYSYRVGPIKGIAFQAGIDAISVAGNRFGKLSYTNAWKEH